MTMDAGVGPCRNCGHHVAITASQCRFCGYDADPTRNERARVVWGLSGLAVTLSAIGAPLGLLLLWKAYQHHCAATRRVVDIAYPLALFPLCLLDDCHRQLVSMTENRRKSR